MAVAFRLADIFSPDWSVFLRLVERQPCLCLSSLLQALSRSVNQFLPCWPAHHYRRRKHGFWRNKRIDAPLFSYHSLSPRSFGYLTITRTIPYTLSSERDWEGGKRFEFARVARFTRKLFSVCSVLVSSPFNTHAPSSSSRTRIHNEHSLSLFRAQSANFKLAHNTTQRRRKPPR